MKTTSTSSSILALVLAGCAGLQSLEDGLRGDDEPVARLAPPTTAADARTTIARLEEARDDGDGLLEILAGMYEPDVRLRATLALGRLSAEQYGDRVTEALIACLADPAASVRAAAAFSLGQRADPKGARGLIEHWADPEPAVRAAIVEAAGRIDDPDLRARVVASMSSPLEEVRRAAVVAPHAWSTGDAEDGGSEWVDRALAEVASRVPRGSALAERLDVPDRSLESTEVIWRALFSLQRRGSSAGRDAYLLHVEDPDARARIFAAKGLAKLVPEEATRAALEARLADPDWRVAVEAARGLGAAADQRSLDALETALAHPSHHVRSTVAEALGNYSIDTARVEAGLESARRDPSAEVRAAVLVARARLGGARSVPEVSSAATEANTVLRAGAARAAAELAAELAAPILLQLTRDDDLLVAGQAVAGLGSCDTDEVHARLVELCLGDDDGLRLAAVGALAEHLRPEDLEPLRRAYRAADSDLGPEVRGEALRAASELEGPDALAFLREGSNDPDPWIRRTADELRRARGEEVRSVAVAPRAVSPARVPGAALDAAGTRPVVEVATTRGSLVFELFPDEAPLHVHNFLELAGRDYYDGLSFHRVVADFVIQGGCHRGDGNGAGTWRGPGDTLRHEFGQRRYVRGSLGMPRNADPDSGGSQFFVTHRPTPHLDGKYTIFGELRDGFEVLDAIQVGDRIVDVVVR